MIAIAGQRLRQVIREPWPSYTLKKSRLNISDLKQSHEKFQSHAVYLNDTAIQIINTMQNISGHCDYPFPGFSRNGQKMMSGTYLSETAANNACKKVLALMRVKLDSKTESFAPKDLRRSCKTLMLNPELKLGISKVDSNHVHNHGDRDVSAINYDWNDYEIDKRDVMEKWDSFLKKEIINKLPKGWKKIAA